MSRRRFDIKAPTRRADAPVSSYLIRPSQWDGFDDASDIADFD